jgi:hypothetical protein
MAKYIKDAMSKSSPLDIKKLFRSSHIFEKAVQKNDVMETIGFTSTSQNYEKTAVYFKTNLLKSKINKNDGAENYVTYTIHFEKGEEKLHGIDFYPYKKEIEECKPKYKCNEEVLLDKNQFFRVNSIDKDNKVLILVKIKTEEGTNKVPKGDSHLIKKKKFRKFK